MIERYSPRWSRKGRFRAQLERPGADRGAVPVRAASSTNRKAASPNLYICVRFLSYHSSAGSWVQPPQPRLPSPLHSLHFPALRRYCCCACFSFPCCSSGWAFSVAPVIFSTSLSGLCHRRLALFAESVSALFFPGAVVIVVVVVLVANVHARMQP